MAAGRLKPLEDRGNGTGRDGAVRSLAVVHDQVVTTVGKVRQWLDEEGWGVIDSPDTLGRCWAHYSSVAVPGYKGSILASRSRWSGKWSSRTAFPTARCAPGLPVSSRSLTTLTRMARRTRTAAPLRITYDDGPASPSTG